MNFVVTVFIVQALLAYSQATPKKQKRAVLDTVIAGVGATTGLIGLIKDFIKNAPEDDQGGKGRYIRFYNFGCLDAKLPEYLRQVNLYTQHCPVNLISLPWINPIKTQEPSAKWCFDGSHLVTQARNANGYVVKQCLDFYEDLWLRKNTSKLTECTKYEKKGWFLKVHDASYATVNGVQQFLFSVHPEDEPEACLTASTVIYCKHHNNLHYTWESGHCSLSHPFVALELKKCTGADEQSFFVDLDFFTTLQELKKSVNEPVSFVKRIAKKEPNTRYYYPYPNFLNYHNDLNDAVGNLVESTSVAITSSGYPCLTACESKGYSYNWCYHHDGWDYCSPMTKNGDRKQYSTYGNICTTTCDFHPKGQTWNVDKRDRTNVCKNGKNHQYEYCGAWIVNDRSKALGNIPVYYTRHSSPSYCHKNECQKKEGYSYYGCYDQESIVWEYCSPIFDLTGDKNYDIHGNQCSSKCHRHKNGRAFCYIGSSWEYCGPQDVKRNCPF